MTDIELVKLAVKAREMAYTPYSHHKVGAALECADGEIILGCNIENAAFSPTCCAERTAFFKAVSEGRYEFTKIAVVGGIDTEKKLGICAPCGVCRQVMREFCSPERFEIILAEVELGENPGDEPVSVKPEKYLLKDILPLSFGPEALI